jgi:hypothetical protein
MTRATGFGGTEVQPFTRGIRPAIPLPMNSNPVIVRAVLNRKSIVRTYSDRTEADIAVGFLRRVGAESIEVTFDETHATAQAFVFGSK